MSIVRHLLTGLLLAALLPTLAGCKAYNEKRQANDLEATLNSYENTMRWRSVADAYGFRPSEALAAGIPDGLEQVRIVSYEVKGPPAMLDEATAAQTVEIGYYHEDTQRVKSLLDRQLWRYDPQLELWRLQSEVPDFR